MVIVDNTKNIQRIIDRIKDRLSRERTIRGLPFLIGGFILQGLGVIMQL